MKNILIIIVFTALGLCSCAQSGKSTKEKDSVSLESIGSTTNDKTPTKSTSDIHTEFNYTDSTGKGVIIQNSYPRGGPFTDAKGNKFGHGVFWTRVINKTDSPIELVANFPADSFPVSSSPDSYFKLLLPPDPMTEEKISLYSYGYDSSRLSSFINTNFNKPTLLQRTIKPNEACLFYVVLIIRLPDNGPIRTGFYLEGQSLFYKVNIDPYGSTDLPCGQINFD